MSLDVDISSLWESPLTEEEVRRFEVAWADDIVARRTPGPGDDNHRACLALKVEFKAAWVGNDPKSLAGLGLILHRERALNDEKRRRLVWALLTQGRFAEACEVSRLSAEDSYEHWFLRARALAGAGELGEAAEALNRAAAWLNHPPPPTNVGEALRDLSRRPSWLDAAVGWQDAYAETRRLLKARRPDKAPEPLRAFHRRRLRALRALLKSASADPVRDWSRVRAQTISLLLLGLGRRAGACLREGLRTSPPSTSSETHEAFRLGCAIAAVSDVDEVAQLLAVLPRPSSGPKRRFIDTAAEVLAGDAPWTSLTAIDPSSEMLKLLVATSLARAGRAEAAIVLFSGLLSTRKRGQALRWELVCCSALESTSRIDLKLQRRTGPPLIVDLFPYNGEIEKLRIKLHEMAPWVDRFVIVEAEETFSGRPKPIHFPGQAAEIQEFLPKITHVVVRRFPEHAVSAWAREYHQRDEAVAALKDVCSPDDLVLLTDVDEVVDRRALEGFDGEFAVLKKDYFRYFFNYRRVDAPQAQRGNLILMRARRLRAYSPSLARTLLSWVLEPNRIERAGWHFTSVGDASTIAHKMSSYSHAENVRPDSEAHYSSHIARLRAGELEAGWERCELCQLPEYIRQNRERLADLIL